MLSVFWPWILFTTPFLTIDVGDGTLQCYRYEGHIYSLTITNVAKEKIFNEEPITLMPSTGANPLCEPEYVCGNCHE